ncbi:hypothetical protein [Tenacibaculum caenipelagi]|uniref:Uncharacterized protein n=1 Tax=Tenacibaculum caenipelagi TaxID=1325435 RepID=A0A4V3D315_9FLAO|nr:hypothetical protein [Tenacibaculum caenipelagi]TDQ27554.1 hypothetical protein DFQ07_1405 [Tenacibaculum caenipelagi]
MKYYALLPLIFLFSALNCKNYTSKDSQNYRHKSEDVSINQGFYFTVNFEFTQDNYQLISKHQNDGNLSFDIQIPTDMFLVAYKKDKLFFYSELTDPLTMRTVGEREMEETMEKGSLNINLPKEFANKDSTKNLDIYIYKVNEYMENFESSVVLKEKLEELEQQQVIRKRYTINASQLAHFLNQ